MTTTPLLDAVKLLADRVDLSETQAHAAISSIMAGEATEAALAAFLTGLRIKGETPEELAGAVRAAREHANPWTNPLGDRELLDTCGTGGDGANTVNISTATAIVVAACGVPVAKHGNRSASGNSGSAEVLVEMGIDIEAPNEVLARSLAELGLTFLFAPRFHPALRHAGAVRRQLPFRTLFNLVGPLANPARPTLQIVGVSGERQHVLVAEALNRLGSRRAAVVRGADGVDEVTLGGSTHVLWVENGEIKPLTWEPEDFGLPRVTVDELRVTGPTDSASRLKALLAGESGPVRSSVLANAAAALLVAEKASELKEGVALASDAIDSGRAADLLERWKTYRGVKPD